MAASFLILISSVARLTEGIEANVAAATGKENVDVRFCNESSSQLVVDGDRQTPQMMERTCDENAFYLVDLKSRHFIHYVIIYEGDTDSG